MQRIPFEPPTNHYDERIESVDEQICQLMKQRKELSDDQPGFPTEQLIAKWAEKYGFQESFLFSVFSNLFHEQMYRPRVEPQNFIKNIPVLRAFEKDETFYTITFVRQYENASVIYLSIDHNFQDEGAERDFAPPHLELSIKGEGNRYDCRNEGGGGTPEHETFTFVVSPALPDHPATYEFVFKGYHTPFQEESSFEFVI